MSCYYSLIIMHIFYFFFFKQKTAYEMRISDWSSDVCSSDLQQLIVGCDNIQSLTKKPQPHEQHITINIIIIIKNRSNRTLGSSNGDVLMPLLQDESNAVQGMKSSKRGKCAELPENDQRLQRASSTIQPDGGQKKKRCVNETRQLVTISVRPRM